MKEFYNKREYELTQLLPDKHREEVAALLASYRQELAIQWASRSVKWVTKQEDTFRKYMMKGEF